MLDFIIIAINVWFMVDALRANSGWWMLNAAIIAIILRPYVMGVVVGLTISDDDFKKLIDEEDRENKKE